MKTICCNPTDLENLHRDLHALVMLWGADGRGGCRRPGHALVHVRLQECILLPMLPLALLLMLQLVSHQLDTNTHTEMLMKTNLTGEINT